SAAQASGRTFAGLSLEATLPFPTPTIGALLQELGSSQPGLPRAFFGWSALVLAVVGLASKRRAVVVAALVVTLLGTVIVLGPNTPLYGIYHSLPTGNWFRVPQRAVMLLGIGIALLAGLGIERLEHRLHRHARWMLVLLILPAIELFHATWSTAPHPQVRQRGTLALPAFVDSLRDRLGVNRGYVVVNWRDRFPFTEKLGTWGGLNVAQDYDPLTPAVYADYINTMMGSAAAIDPLFSGRYIAPPGGPERRGLDLLAVRLLVVAPGSRFMWDGVPYPGLLGKPLLIENPHAVPRALLAHRVESAGDRAQALQRLRDPDFDPQNSAVVTGGHPLETPSESARESVEITAAANDRLTVHARVAQPPLLVVSDLIFPGWTVSVDSAPAEMVPANGIFRGVYLEPGDHQIQFVYQPRAVSVGLAISLTSALVLAVLGAWPQQHLSPEPK